MEDLIINEHLAIPASELQLIFARSSGPGGQNVNKVNTKATLIWNLSKTNVLNVHVAARLRVLAANRMTDSGELYITCQTQREQSGNIRACRERLKQLILQALKPPIPRKPTRPSYGSKVRRLNDKKMTSQRKQNRTGNWE